MRALLIGSGVVAMVFAAAAAQAGPNNNRQEVKVPFGFTVNGQEMPAGSYSVLQDDSQSGTLLIQGQHSAAYVLTAPVASGSGPQDTSLVFEKDGKGYRLMQVWDDAGDGVSIVETK